LSPVEPAFMRPEILFPLFAPLESLPGLGPRLKPLYERLVGGAHVVDALWHLPSGRIDRRFAPTVAAAPDGAIATLTVTVDGHEAPPPRSRSPYKVRCHDATGALTLVFFHGRRDYLEHLLPVGREMVVSGRVEHFNDAPQMAHPDHVVPLSERAEVETVEAVYPLTTGITAKVAAKLARAALARAPALPEWQDPAWLARRRWRPWRTALEAVHAPVEEDDLGALAPDRQRLAYDEMLANQLALLLVRRSARRQAGRALAGDGRLRGKVLAALPFALTGAQERTLTEIFADMAAAERMLRLLQGDVGSGKTVVALLAMLNAVETGAQAALMAPTELLARQHAETLAPLCHAAGVRLALLTGRDKGVPRQDILDRLAAGAIDILVGTHALFSQDVAFRDLALAVIDEQHRFGVHQRLELAAKGRHADVLVMTATPIPRTLTLTLYGDMDVSRLDEKPPGRKPVTTRALPNSRLGEVVAAAERAVAGGSKVYWVCPLVEDAEGLDLANAEGRHAHLKTVFGDRVGLVHGRMKGPDKDSVMEAFAGDGLDVLVATTVIEVGVDVPAATVMVIEHAERFGLAPLHQLRGRIGRGAAASTCLLLYQPPLTATAKARLETMRGTEDGFVIAEEDLRLRGGGEVLGTRQSGLPEFRLADVAAHGELLAAARDDARLIVERDAELQSERGRALRVLLYLFERDAAIMTLRSG
jgi:ATP-dependent DNA helicase RecG